MPTTRIPVGFRTALLYAPMFFRVSKCTTSADLCVNKSIQASRNCHANLHLELFWPKHIVFLNCQLMTHGLTSPCAQWRGQMISHLESSTMVQQIFHTSETAHNSGPVRCLETHIHSNDGSFKILLYFGKEKEKKDVKTFFFLKCPKALPNTFLFSGEAPPLVINCLESAVALFFSLVVS